MKAASIYVVRCGALLIAVFAWLVPASAADEKLPNIVVIVADDLGYNDVSYHGSEIATPNLDKLSGAGVRLEDYYVFATCSPTRTALLTGRNPSRWGIYGPIGGRSELAVPPETTTLADALKSRGYATASVGKWHLGLRPEVGPRQYGFDSTYGYLHGQIDPYTHLYKNGDRTWHRNDVFQEETGHATDLLAAEAVKQIETPREQPLFLYVAFSVPHTPIEEEERWVKPYESKIADPSRRLYAASVAHMDDAIGRIVAALQRSGKFDNTLLVFTSDNGGQENDPMNGTYGGKYKPFTTLGNNLPLRGWKGELYEGGIRVPGFVTWPGKFQPREVHAPLSVLDWMPTLLGIVGVPVAADWKLEGQDIRRQLEGGSPAGPRTYYWSTGRTAAVREGDWKLIQPAGKNPKLELYNEATDPYEKTDQAAAHPEIVTKLAALLKEQQALDPKTSGPKSKD